MATYHSEHGDLHAIVTDEGDPARLLVAANKAAADSGTGDWFVREASEGDGNGEYSK